MHWRYGRPARSVPAWVGPEHGANEGVSEAALKRALAVYVLAFDRLLTLYERR